MNRSIGISYSAYRKQLLGLVAGIAEQEIYVNWIELTIGRGWHVQSEPAVGYDGRYHLLYISVRDDGFIYIGRHSTSNLNDNYQGSGIDVEESKKAGHTFVTTALEFFRDEDAAASAEAFVVTENFINETNGLTLNNTVGGKSERKRDSVKNNVRPEPTKRPPIAGVNVKYYTFDLLGVKVGDKLTHIVNGKEDGQTCTVLDGINKVSYNGRKSTLSVLTGNLEGKTATNPLYHWNLNGKSLAEIRDSIRKGNER